MNEDSKPVDMKKIAEMLTGEEHVWLKGLKPEEAGALRKMYRERYHQ